MRLCSIYMLPFGARSIFVIEMEVCGYVPVLIAACFGDLEMALVLQLR